jgi:hypothetical protein
MTAPSDLSRLRLGTAPDSCGGRIYRCSTRSRWARWSSRPYGEPVMPPLLDAFAALDRELFRVIEQDLYPVEPDLPLPIATRTAGWFAGCGLGPVRRWPYQPVN